MGNRREGTNEALKVMTINITREARETIEKLVEWGKYASITECIRNAINNQLKEDLAFMKIIKYINSHDAVRTIKNEILIPGYRPFTVKRRLE